MKTWKFPKLTKEDCSKIKEIFLYIQDIEDHKKQLENLIRDMLFDIPVIPERYKYVNRLKEIVK